MRFMGTFQHITDPIVDSWEWILENLVIRYNHCGREGKRQGEFTKQTATATLFKGCCSAKWARQGKGVGKIEKTLGRWWWKVVVLGEGTESSEQKRFGNGAWRMGVICWKRVRELRSTAGTWTLGQEGWEVEYWVPVTQSLTLNQYEMGLSLASHKQTLIRSPGHTKLHLVFSWTRLSGHSLSLSNKLEIS